LLRHTSTALSRLRPRHCALNWRRSIASWGPITALEAGIAIEQLTDQLTRRTKEREGLQARIRLLDSKEQVSAEQMSRAITELGGLATVLASADPTERAKVYASLGIRLDYDHQAKTVKAQADQGCVFSRVRRGT